jgi:hypothetical protein
VGSNLFNNVSVIQRLKISFNTNLTQKSRMELHYVDPYQVLPGNQNLGSPLLVY